jgi:hypothetical protein
MELGSCRGKSAEEKQMRVVSELACLPDESSGPIAASIEECVRDADD